MSRARDVSFGSKSSHSTSSGKIGSSSRLFKSVSDSRRKLPKNRSLSNLGTPHSIAATAKRKRNRKRRDLQNFKASIQQADVSVKRTSIERVDEKVSKPEKAELSPVSQMRKDRRKRRQGKRNLEAFKSSIASAEIITKPSPEATTVERKSIRHRIQVKTASQDPNKVINQLSHTSDLGEMMRERQKHKNNLTLDRLTALTNESTDKGSVVSSVVDSVVSIWNTGRRNKKRPSKKLSGFSSLRNSLARASKSKETEHQRKRKQYREYERKKQYYNSSTIGSRNSQLSSTMRSKNFTELVAESKKNKPATRSLLSVISSSSEEDDDEEEDFDEEVVFNNLSNSFNSKMSTMRSLANKTLNRVTSKNFRRQSVPEQKPGHSPFGGKKTVTLPRKKKVNLEKPAKLNPSLTLEKRHPNSWGGVQNNETKTEKTREVSLSRSMSSNASNSGTSSVDQVMKANCENKKSKIFNGLRGLQKKVKRKSNVLRRDLSKFSFNKI